MLIDRGTLVFAQRDSEGLIEIVDQDGVRTLYFGTRAAQSSMLLYAPATLALEYTRCMLAALLFQPRPRRILLIGLGGGSLARFLLQYLPQAQIDCVEMRPSVVDLARRYFQLPDRKQLRIHVGDGSEFLRDSTPDSFDLILVDAFDGAGVHESVCPASFYADCRRALTATGVLSTNLWATPNSPLNDICTEMQQGFEGQILRLPVEKRANLIALGLSSPQSRKDLKQLREPAHELATRLGIDFPKQLQRIEQHNGSAIRRLMSWAAR
jgi:spermidine synthase